MKKEKPTFYILTTAYNDISAICFDEPTARKIGKGYNISVVETADTDIWHIADNGKAISLKDHTKKELAKLDKELGTIEDFMKRCKEEGVTIGKI